MKLHTSQAINLVSAVIEFAIYEYRTLVYWGVIRDDTVNPDAWQSGKVRLRLSPFNRYLIVPGMGQFSAAEIPYLIQFFQPGGRCEEWMSLAGFKIDFNELRASLVKPLERPPKRPPIIACYDDYLRSNRRLHRRDRMDSGGVGEADEVDVQPL